jgi:hypothetical protein
MFRYQKRRHPKLNCCRIHRRLDEAQLDIHQLMANKDTDKEKAALAYLFDNFGNCLQLAKILDDEDFDSDHMRNDPLMKGFPTHDHLRGSAYSLYYQSERAEFGSNDNPTMLNRWIKRYDALIALYQCQKCLPTHLLCCQLRRQLSPISLEHFLYVKWIPENYKTHIYLPFPNQTWAMYIRDHIGATFDQVVDPDPPFRTAFGVDVRELYGQAYLNGKRSDRMVKQLHALLEPGYRATSVKVRFKIRAYMSHLLYYDRDSPLCLQLGSGYICSKLKPLYWDNFSVEFPDTEDNSNHQIIMFQFRDHVLQNTVFLETPGAEVRVPSPFITQHLNFPSLKKLSQRLGGKYSLVNMGIIGNRMANAFLNLLSNPHVLQATMNSLAEYYHCSHDLLNSGFLKLLLKTHEKLADIESESRLADYSWNVVEYLQYGLNGGDEMDNPRSELLQLRTSRMRWIWERHSWDYLPLLRAAMVLSKYPIFLLWFSRTSTRLTMNPSRNQDYLSQAEQDMDNVALEMQLAGVTSTYFLQLYLQTLGKYALEVFVAVHIKPVYSYWWKHVSALSSPCRSVKEPPMCSCSDDSGDDHEEWSFHDLKFEDFFDQNDILEVEE